MTLRKELWEEFPFLTTKKWLYFVARTTVQKGMTVANNKKNHPLGKLTFFFLLSFDSYWEIKKNPPLQKSWRGDKKPAGDQKVLSHRNWAKKAKNK